MRSLLSYWNYWSIVILHSDWSVTTFYSLTAVRYILVCIIHRSYGSDCAFQCYLEVGLSMFSVSCVIRNVISNFDNPSLESNMAALHVIIELYYTVYYPLSFFFVTLNLLHPQTILTYRHAAMLLSRANCHIEFYYWLTLADIVRKYNRGVHLAFFDS